jgi:hypothetical protein
MLYERWLKVATEQRAEVALVDFARRRELTFGELATFVEASTAPRLQSSFHAAVRSNLSWTFCAGGDFARSFVRWKMKRSGQRFPPVNCRMGLRT